MSYSEQLENIYTRLYNESRLAKMSEYSDLTGHIKARSKKRKRLAEWNAKYNAIPSRSRINKYERERERSLRLGDRFRLKLGKVYVSKPCL